MSIYVDTSALLKRYLDEPDADHFEDLLRSDPEWVTARHTIVEARRNLCRLLASRDLVDANAQLTQDWARFHVVELDQATCELASGVAVLSGARTLDALHLGAAYRAGGGSLPFLTADVRRAQAARSLGWDVRGI